MPAAALSGLLLTEKTGVQNRNDRHLHAWHRIQRKACRDLRNAARALGDHDKVDYHQDDEHDNAYGVVATHQIMAECLDHLAGRVRPCMALHQHNPG